METRAARVIAQLWAGGWEITLTKDNDMVPLYSISAESNGMRIDGVGSSVNDAVHVFVEDAKEQIARLAAWYEGGE